MKAGWESKPLGDIAITLNGLWKGKKPPFRPAKVLRNTNFRANGEISFEDVAEIDVQVNQFAKRKLLRGDIILERSGGGPKQPVGRVAYFDSDDENYSFSNFTSVIRAKNTNVDTRYLHHLLNSWHTLGVTEQMQKRSNGIRNLKFQEYKEKFVPIPPLEEQRHIVALLDEVFSSLDSSRENVKANLADAEELFSRLRDDLLINVDGENDFEFAEILQIASGLVDPKVEPYLSKRHVGAGNMVSDTGELIGLQTAEEEGLTSGKYEFDTNAVLYSKIRPYLKKACAPDFNGICSADVYPLTPDSNHLTREYLLQVLLSDRFTKFAISGSARAGMPKVNRKHLMSYRLFLPSIDEQVSIVDKIHSLQTVLQKLKTAGQKKLNDLDDLRNSLLERAFTGKLTQSTQHMSVNDNERNEQLSTATLVLAYEKHRLEKRHKTFGHVKAQKTLHLTESIGGLDLGRHPKVRQAGPHDQDHFDRVESWAAQNEIFRFQQRRTGQRGYDFICGESYNEFLSEAKTLLADYKAGLSRFLPLITDMNTEEAEVFTTVHAAWNNLLSDGKTPSDDDIVYAAREGWHESKTNIARQKFVDAITKIRRHALEPDGSAKYVHGAQESLI